MPNKKYFTNNIYLVLIFIGTLCLFFLCSKKTKNGLYIIGFSQYNSIEPLRIAMNNSIFDEAIKYSDILKLEFADGEQDPLKQESDIENFLEAKIDLLIVAPKGDNSLTSIMKRDYESKIPVIVLDQMPEDEYYTCFIGVDNQAIGRDAGKFAADTLNGKGNIVVIQGLPGSYTTEERNRGFNEIISKYPELNIVYTDVTDWLIPLSITKMEIALREHNKIDFVFAHNDQMAMGAYLASRSHNRESRIIFVGVGGLSGSIGELQAVKEGKINATFLYPTYGKEALEYALKILNGEKVPKVVELKTRMITIEDIEN